VSGRRQTRTKQQHHRCNSAWCSRRQLLLFLIVIRETGRRIRTTGRRRPCVVDGLPLPTRASHTPTRSGCRRFPRSSCVPYECRRYAACTSYYTLVWYNIIHKHIILCTYTRYIHYRCIIFIMRSVILLLL